MRLTISHVYSYENKYNPIGGNAHLKKFQSYKIILSVTLINEINLFL